MVSTMGDASLADAIVNRELISDFDEQLAYKAIRNDAFTEVVDPATGKPFTSFSGHGRPNLKEYVNLGYFPADAAYNTKESVSISLNCMLADYSISRAASALGYTEDAAELSRRSSQYSKLWSAQGKSKGFFAPRYAGSEPRNGMVTDFKPLAWGGAEYKRRAGKPRSANSAAYSEGGPWCAPYTLLCSAHYSAALAAAHHAHSSAAAQNNPAPPQQQNTHAKQSHTVNSTQTQQQQRCPHPLFE